MLNYTRKNLVLLEKRNKASDTWKNVIIAFFCLLAIILSGMRDVNSLPDYNDTHVFQFSYEQISRMSWQEIFNNFSFFSNEYSSRDSGYSIFVKVTQMLYKDFTFFMFLTAAIFLVPFSLLVRKYVKTYLGVILAFLFYFSLFTSIVNSFMRQAVALGIILFTIKYIINHNWKKYFALLAIAFTIHSSSIVALPFYFLPRIITSRKWITYSFIISLILIMFNRILFSFLLTGTMYDNYVRSEAENPMNYLLLIVFISFIAYISFDELKKIEDSNILLGGVMGTILLLPIIFMGNTLLRVSYYYVILYIPLLSLIIDNMKTLKGGRKGLYAFSILLFTYFIFR